MKPDSIQAKAKLAAKAIGLGKCQVKFDREGNPKLGKALARDLALVTKRTGVTREQMLRGAEGFMSKPHLLAEAKPRTAEEAFEAALRTAAQMAGVYFSLNPHRSEHN
jgi:hypothetical protein